MDFRSLIVFGGSFDPPHVAHVVLPMCAREAAGADAVAYVPAARAPHKEAGSQTNAAHRLAMLRLALEGHPHALVLTDELDRTATEPGRPSYTVDTLEALRARLGRSVTLRLLIGGDMLRTFHTWRMPERIADLAEPLVMVRPPETRDELLTALPPGYRREEWEPRLLDLPRMDVSSTDIRRRVREGRPISGLVAPAVEAYIRREGLYGSAKSEVRSTESEREGDATF